MDSPETRQERYSIRQRAADHPDSRALLAAYVEELHRRLGHQREPKARFDRGIRRTASAAELSPPEGLFLVLYAEDRAAACGGLKRWSADTAEVKRMYVAPEARRRGHGRRVLAALEAAALELGCPRLVLDTAAPLAEARALYAGAGYREVAPYNDNPYASAWLFKDSGQDLGLAHPRHRSLWPRVAPGPCGPTDLAHDRYHLGRVYRWCLRLAAEAGADPDLAGAAGLVHDLADVPKEDPGRGEAGDLAAAAAADPLAAAGYAPGEVERITAAVRGSNWSAGQAPAGDLARVLQDADRLDAAGAVGIARSFACAQGMAGRGRRLRLYDPADPLARGDREPDDGANAVDHFRIKLLGLAQGMHLPAARAEARRRLSTMEAFLDQLAREVGP